VDVNNDAGLAMPDAITVGCSFADIDNDGDPDLFVSTVRHGNRLFENLGNGKYRDVTQKAGVGYVGHSSGAVFFDYDGDGVSEMAMRWLDPVPPLDKGVTKLSGVLSEAFVTFDLDNDSTKGNETDYDMSLRGAGGPGCQLMKIAEGLQSRH